MAGIRCGFPQRLQAMAQTKTPLWAGISSISSARSAVTSTSRSNELAGAQSGSRQSRVEGTMTKRPWVEPTLTEWDPEDCRLIEKLLKQLQAAHQAATS